MTHTSPRQFLPWTGHALPAAAAWMAEHYGVEDRLDMSGAAVVLPGARAGRRLKELLVAEAENRNMRLRPPAVLTVGAAPELLYRPQRPIADGEACRRVWLQALRTLRDTERGVLFPHAPQPDDVRAWFALADVVAGLHRTVGAAGRSFDDVAAKCVEVFDDSARWHLLARLQHEFAAELERRGLGDRELARMQALADDRISCDGDLWFIGVAEMPLLLRRMLERVPPDQLHILVHAPSGMADAFDALGCVQLDHWLHAEINIADERLAIVGHPAAQAREAAAAVARLNGRHAADEIVVGVPDVEVVPTLEREFASAGVVTRYLAGEGDERGPEFRMITAGVPARYAAGVPMERTSPFRLLVAVAALLRDQSYESAAALVRHPAFGDWLQRTRWDVEHTSAAAFRRTDGWLAALDQYLCERAPHTITGELDGLGGAGGRGRKVVEALRMALLSERMLGGLKGVRPLREWMAPVLELVLEIYGDRALSRHEREEQRLLRFAQKLRDVAGAFERMPPDLDVECDAATAIQLVLDGIAHEALPPDADDEAIELLGWLELHLDDAPVAILTGMNEPFVPEAMNADAFLPNALRSRLGIEDNNRRYARDAYQLTAMLHSRHVHLIAGRRTLLGDPLRPSRLLLATSGDVLARRVRAYLGDEAADRSPVAVTHDAGAKSGFDLPPERVITLPAVPTSLSVTGFGSVLENPYAWALEQVVSGDVIDDTVRELDPLRFGSLAHRVLETFGRSPAAASDDAAIVRAALESCLDEHVAMHYGAVFPAVRLQVEQLRMRLRAFAAAHAQRVAEGWTIVAVECETPEEGVPLHVDGTDFFVRGKIDRVERNRTTGEWAVFDYKSGDRPNTPERKHLNKDVWVDLQLPLYRFILPYVVDGEGQRVFDGDANAAVRLGYIQLCGDPGGICFDEAGWTAVQLDGALEAAHEVVRTIRDNRFEFPGLDSGWYDDDTAEMLGRGRLVLEDEDEIEEGVQ